MQQVFPEQLTCPQLSKNIPACYTTRRFITALTSAHHIENQRPCEMFRIFVSFYGEEWLAPHPTLKLQGTLVCCTRLFIRYIRSYPSYLETVPPFAVWESATLWWQGPTYHRSSTL